MKEKSLEYQFLTAATKDRAFLTYSVWMFGHLKQTLKHIQREVAFLGKKSELI
jgi:hypothetical protein